LNPQSPKYKPWAEEGQFGKDRVYCTLCKRDLRVDSLYGSNGYLKNPEHFNSKNNEIKTILTKINLKSLTII